MGASSMSENWIRPSKWPRSEIQEWVGVEEPDEPAPEDSQRLIVELCGGGAGELLHQELPLAALRFHAPTTTIGG